MALAGRRYLSLGGSVALHACFAGILIGWSVSHPFSIQAERAVPVKIVLNPIVIPAKVPPQNSKTSQPVKAPPSPTKRVKPVEREIAQQPVQSIMPLEPAAVPAVTEKISIHSPIPSPSAAPIPAINTKITDKEAEYGADYLENPNPVYPKISVRLGEEGRVLLRVLVSKEGLALQVDLKTSSGFERLDRAAQTAVKKWRFIPAKKGDETVEGWVNIPINFQLSS